MWQRIVGGGIEIRQFVPADAGEIFAAVERDRQYLRQWLPWVDLTRTADDVFQFLTRAEAQIDAGQGPNAGIWIDGKLSGSIGVHPIDWVNRSCALGYWLRSTLQGTGIVTRCCEVLLRYLFDELGLHRVEIRCGTGNARSCAIPQRLGFTRESVAREAQWVNDRWVDLVVWSMLEQEWRKRG